MSDQDRESSRPSSGGDDEALEVLFEALAGADEERLLELGRTPEGRRWVETLALLPWGLDPVAPPPALGRRILERAREAGVAGVEPVSRRSGRWLLPLAAGLAIGFAALSGWQIVRLEAQSERIAALESRLATDPRTGAELADLRTKIDLLTSPGAEYCALAPPPESEFPRARGTVVMQAVTDAWLLSADGLEPCARGRKYHLWFHTGETVVHGATFAPGAAGERVEVLSQPIPPGVRAISITLEEEAALEPGAPPVLYGDERMQIL